MKQRLSSVRLQFVFVLLLAVILIWPLFKTKYLDYWGSIDATFIADARYLSENWPHPGWQPLWYGGTRFDYIYPPALRYGSAALSRYAGVTPARGYHLYTAIFYALGIGAVWLMVWVGTNCRARAWLASAGAAFLSPSMALFNYLDADADPFLPQRLNALLRYGEGPHITAFSLLPFVFAAAWWGLRPGRPGMLAWSAIAAALVVSNNFYGATALAIFFPLLVWALYVTTRDVFVWIRAGAVALLAYGLTAFWLTPDYIEITRRNLSIVSQPGNLWSLLVALAAAGIFAVLTWRLAAGRTERAWTVFVTGGAVFMALNVLGNHYVNFRVAGEPLRLIPELDLFLVLAGVEIIRLVGKWKPAVAAALVVASLVPAWGYLQHPWRHILRTPTYNDRIEFKLADWVDQHRPGSRSFATGTVRFWWNAWHNGAQIGGGSEQGLLNIGLMPMYWHLFMSEDPDPGILWLQATGTDLVIVNDDRSMLPIRDFQFPRKYMGKLPVIFHDGSGNWIHEVPRRWRSLARVVRLADVQSLQPVRHGEDVERLAPYVAALEKGPDSPILMSWTDSRTAYLGGTVRAGEAVTVQVAYDEAWRATSDGRTLPIERDALGQIRILVPPGDHHILLHWDTPRQNLIGRALTGLTVAVCLLLFWRSRRK